MRFLLLILITIALTGCTYIYINTTGDITCGDLHIDKYQKIKPDITTDVSVIP